MQKDFVKAGFSFSQRHFTNLNRNMQPLKNETTGKIKFMHGSMPQDLNHAKTALRVLQNKHCKRQQKMSL